MQNSELLLSLTLHVILHHCLILIQGRFIRTLLRVYLLPKLFAIETTCACCPRKANRFKLSQVSLSNVTDTGLRRNRLLLGVLLHDN